MKPKPTRKPGERLLAYVARLNDWEKEKLKEAKSKKNEEVKRAYRIQSKKTDGN